MDNRKPSYEELLKEGVYVSSGDDRCIISIIQGEDGCPN